VGEKVVCPCDVLAGTKLDGESAACRLVGDTLDRIWGAVVGGRVLSKEEIPYNEDLIVRVPVIFENEDLIVVVPVIFAGPIPPPFLLYIIAPTLTEAVVAKAATATTAMAIWAAIDIPAATLAAVAIVPAPVATDVPTDVAAWVAID
jgi:hypothetical protein